MASDAFQVEVDAEALTKILDRLSEGVGAFEGAGHTLDPELQIVSAMMTAEVVDKFQNSGPGWAALQYKRKRGGEAQILVDTGVLRGSINGDRGPDWARVSTPVHYGEFHVTGTESMPARDFLELEDRVFDDAERVVIDGLVHRYFLNA